VVNQIQRKRGAPKGNRNALKHGYYSRALNPAEQSDFRLAAGLEGISEEIALLRFQIKKAVTSGDIKNLTPLSKVAFALEKLIRTNHRFFLERQNRLQDAFKSVIKDILLPLESNSINSAVIDKFSRQIHPNTNQKTNNPIKHS
jgi:hypothetical protein